MPKQINHHYALIMAGGAGTRLYPRSREDRPKQFQKIIGGKTLLVQTYQRIKPVVGADHIFISTNHKYTKLVFEQLPQLKGEQLITEPVKRNTAPAMALATALIAQKDPQALIVTLASDHVVLKEANFRQAVETGFNALTKNPHRIVTIGIQPTFPHTGYGYIERAKHVYNDGEFSIYSVKRFVEKPDRKTAEKYLAKGAFYWNAAYFVWQADYFLDQVKKFLPSVYRGLKKIVAAAGQPNFQQILDKEFHKFPSEPVDTAVMEKTEKLLVVPADLGWSDVGSWDAVADLIDDAKRSAEGNYSQGLHIGVDTHNSVILAEDTKRLVATIGLDNVIVVTTGDAVLIAARGRSEEVKKVIEELKTRQLHHLL